MIFRGPLIAVLSVSCLLVSAAVAADIEPAPKTYVSDRADTIDSATEEKLIGLLECRLDAIVYRAKFVATVFASRQFVNHGHVKVNGRRVNIPSYRCKPGDVVEEGDCAASSGWIPEYLAEHPEEDRSLPVGFIAKSLADCKRMAIAFTDSVS